LIVDINSQAPLSDGQAPMVINKPAMLQLTVKLAGFVVFQPHKSGFNQAKIPCSGNYLGATVDIHFSE